MSLFNSMNPAELTEAARRRPEVVATALYNALWKLNATAADLLTATNTLRVLDANLKALRNDLDGQLSWVDEQVDPQADLDDG